MSNTNIQFPEQLTIAKAMQLNKEKGLYFTLSADKKTVLVGSEPISRIKVKH